MIETSPIKKYVPVITAALIAAVIPLVTGLMHKHFYLTQLTMSAYYTLAALGLCLLVGFAGQISLGQAGFFAMGAYTSAVLSQHGTDPRLAFFAAVLLAFGTALLIGMPILKLKGHYLAMATLGFGIIIEKMVRAVPLFGGADGLSNIPPLVIFGDFQITGGKADRIFNYYAACFILITVFALFVNLLRSRSGRALRALHGNEEAADAAGVDTARAKLTAFAAAAAAAAAAGSLLTHFNGSIGPGEALNMKSIRYLSIVAVGGFSGFTGTITAGMLLNFLSLRGVFGKYDDAVFGVILVSMMIAAPEGFSIRKLGSYIRNKKNERKTA